jgi:4-hydroxybenzoate polyprenyltransferase
VQAVLALRPRQWTKNLLVFAGLVFAGRLLDLFSDARAMLAFAVFCLVSGVVYIFNDLADVEQDRLHPTKRWRPLASGRLKPGIARLMAIAALLLAAALTALLVVLPPDVSLTSVSFSLAPLHVEVAFSHPRALLADTDTYTRYGGSGLLFGAGVATYLAINLAYTLRLKHVVLVDVFAIAAGFVLRAMAGAFAVAVHISPWLYLCTILLALFLALGKRRQELVALAGDAGAHRPILALYTPQLLDQLIVIVTSSMVMAYSLYTFQGDTGNHRLMVTIPFVLYGVFRYLYLIYVRGEGGSPEEVLLRDPHVRASVVLCVLTIGLVLYVVPI